MEDKAPGLCIRPPAYPARYRWLFFAAAWWNWLVAAASLFGDSYIRTALSMRPSVDALSLQLSISCICLLGIGYYWVAKDVSKNHAIVRIGLIGKLAVFSIFLGHAIAGNIPYAFAAPTVIDLIFAILFLEFLLHIRRAERQSRVGPV